MYSMATKPLKCDSAELRGAVRVKYIPDFKDLIFFKRRTYYLNNNNFILIRYTINTINHLDIRLS